MSGTHPGCRAPRPSDSAGALTPSVLRRSAFGVGIEVRWDLGDLILGMHLGRLRRALLSRRDVHDTEHDATVNRVDLEDADVHRHPFPRHVGRAVHLAAGHVEVRDRDEALDVVADVDDDALVHEARDLAWELGADRIGLTDAEPGILARLLESERDALVV